MSLALDRIPALLLAGGFGGVFGALMRSSRPEKLYGDDRSALPITFAFGSFVLGYGVVALGVFAERGPLAFRAGGEFLTLSLAAYSIAESVRAFPDAPLARRILYGMILLRTATVVVFLVPYPGGAAP